MKKGCFNVINFFSNKEFGCPFRLDRGFKWEELMSLTKQDISFKFLAIEDSLKNGLTLKSAYGRTNDFLSWLIHHAG